MMLDLELGIGEEPTRILTLKEIEESLDMYRRIVIVDDARDEDADHKDHKDDHGAR